LPESPHEKGLRLAHQSGDPWTLGMHSWMAGYFHFYGGDVARGREFLEESVRLLRQTGDQWALSGPLHYLAILLYGQGEKDLWRVYRDECREVAYKIGDKWRIAEYLFALQRTDDHGGGGRSCRRSG